MDHQDAETDDTGIVAGGGSGGGSEAVTDEHPEERGGPKWALILSVVLSVFVLLVPILWAIRRLTGSAGQVWTWAAILVFIAAAALLTIYMIVRRSL